MKNAFLNIAILAMVAGGLYFGIRKRPFGSPLSVPLFVFLAACAISGVFGLNRLASLYQTAQYALAAALFTIVFRQKDDWMKEAYLRLIVFVSLIVNIVILFEVSTDVSRYLPMYKNSATFRTIGHVFAFTLFSYPISLFAVFRWKSNVIRIASTINIIVGAFILFLLWGIDSIFWLFLILPVLGAIILHAFLRSAEKSKAAGALSAATMAAVFIGAIAVGIGFYYGLIELTKATQAEREAPPITPGRGVEFFTSDFVEEPLPDMGERHRMVLEDVHETPEKFFDIEIFHKWRQNNRHLNVYCYRFCPFSFNCNIIIGYSTNRNLR